MSWQFTPYAMFLFVAACAVFGIAVMLRRYRTASGAAALAVMMVAAGIWDLGAGLEMSATELPAKLLWAKTQYVGIVTVPVAWLAFSLGYTGREEWLSRRNVALLCVIPVVTLLLAITNEFHGLIWSKTALVRDGGIWELYLEHGPAFWAVWVYSYALLLAGTVLMVLTLFNASRIYQSRGFVVLIAVAAPWLGNALYVFHVSPLGGIDLTPFAFAACGGAMFYGISNLRLLGLAPVARNAIFDYIRDGVVVIDLHGRVTDMNSVAQNIPELPCKKQIVRAGHLGLRPDLIPLFTGESTYGELRLGGWERPRDYAVESYDMKDRKGQPRGRMLLLRDVTEQRRIREQLRQSEERYRAVVEQAAEGIFLCDIESRKIVESNAAFQSLLGYSPAELNSMTLYNLIDHAPEDVDEKVRLIFNQRKAYLGERRYRHKDGTLVDTGVSSSIVSYCGREVLCTVVRDLTGQKEVENLLEYRAFHDPLTELPNRAMFTQRLEQAVSSGRAVALLFIDLDDFKSINDDLGHEVGDELLVQVANRIAGCLRSDDLAARLGGDEFTVLVGNISEAGEAETVLRRLEERLRSPFRIDGRMLRVGASIGLAISEPGDCSAQALLREADIAMYGVKRAGKSLTRGPISLGDTPGVPDDRRPPPERDTAPA